MKTNQTIYLLADYVNAATDMAESLIKDIRNDKKISHKTVLALNKFKAAAYAMKDTQDELNRETQKNN